MRHAGYNPLAPHLFASAKRATVSETRFSSGPGLAALKKGDRWPAQKH
jgi:hypothetical protein